MNPHDDARKLEDLYGRFEHALKRSGHLKKGRPDAQADWESFARILGEQFFEEVASSGIADTLLNDPPRKLMAESLSWQPKQPLQLTNVAALFVQGVCRVRHSYVHYEKFVSDGEQWERDAKLVHEALEVLRLAESQGIVELPKPR
jgi:hypothetical protein